MAHHLILKIYINISTVSFCKEFSQKKMKLNQTFLFYKILNIISTYPKNNEINVTTKIT